MAPDLITAIEPQRRRQKRRSIFVNDEFFCGVDQEIVLTLKLEVGQEVDRKKLSKILFQEELKKAKDYAFNLLTYRSRSYKEITDRLKGKGYDQEVVEKVVKDLERLEFLNDHKFACDWVENRMQTSPRGRKLLSQELKRKGIGAEIVEEVLDEALARRDEDELALKLAKRRMKRYSSLAPPIAKRRLYSFLGRRGFSYDTISEVLERIFAK